MAILLLCFRIICRIVLVRVLPVCQRLPMTFRRHGRRLTGQPASRCGLVDSTYMSPYHLSSFGAFFHFVDFRMPCAHIPNDPHEPRASHVPWDRIRPLAMPLIRLLQRKSDGRIVFRETTSGDVPAYAILSHTWGKEEVTFQDMEDSADISKTISKARWKKI